MKTEAIAETELTVADETDIAALIATAFNVDFGGRTFYAQRHHLRLVRRDEGRLVAHLALTLRALRLDDRLHTVAGIAEVATDAAHRRAGHAAALVAGAVDIAETWPVDFMVLFGDEAIYSRAGFVAMPNPVTHVRMSGARTGPALRQHDTSLMVRPIRDIPWDPEAELDLLGSLF